MVDMGRVSFDHLYLLGEFNTPGQVQLVLQHRDGLPDGLDLGYEALHRQVGAELDVGSSLTVLQTGLGQLQG